MYWWMLEILHVRIALSMNNILVDVGSTLYVRMTLSMNNVLVDVGSTICQDDPQYEQCIGGCWKYYMSG